MLEFRDGEEDGKLYVSVPSLVNWLHDYAEMLKDYKGDPSTGVQNAMAALLEFDVRINR